MCLHRRRARDGGSRREADRRGRRRELFVVLFDDGEDDLLVGVVSLEDLRATQTVVRV